MFSVMSGEMCGMLTKTGEGKTGSKFGQEKVGNSGGEKGTGLAGHPHS
jgi:hypothetical protein